MTGDDWGALGFVAVAVLALAGHIWAERHRK